MELEIQTMQPGERLYADRQSTQLEGQKMCIRDRIFFRWRMYGLFWMLERKKRRLDGYRVKGFSTFVSDVSTEFQRFIW